MVVLQRVLVAVRAVRNHHAAPRQIYRVHCAVEELHALQQLANRIDDVRHIQIARCYFVQHRREQKVVLAVDQRDFQPLATLQRALKLQRRVKPGESSAQNHDPSWLALRHGLRVPCSLGKGHMLAAPCTAHIANRKRGGTRPRQLTAASAARS